MTCSIAPCTDRAARGTSREGRVTLTPNKFSAWSPSAVKIAYSILLPWTAICRTVFQDPLTGELLDARARHLGSCNRERRRQDWREAASLPGEWPGGKPPCDTAETAAGLAARFPGAEGPLCGRRRQGLQGSSSAPFRRLQLITASAQRWDPDPSGQEPQEVGVDRQGMKGTCQQARPTPQHWPRSWLFPPRICCWLPRCQHVG